MGRRKRAKRKEKLAAAGWEKPPFFESGVHYKQLALRHLYEREFNFDRAIQKLQSRTDYYRRQIQKGLKKGRSRKDIASARKQLAVSINALKELKYLRTQGPDAWYSKALRLYQRDLLAAVKDHPYKPMTTEHKAKTMLGIVGVFRKEDLSSLRPEQMESLVGVAVSIKHPKRFTEERLEFSLKNAINLARAEITFSEQRVEEARGRRVSEKVIAELERHAEGERDVLYFLQAIDFSPTAEKYKRIQQLLD